MRRRAIAGVLTLLLVVSTLLSAGVRSVAAATETDYMTAARQLNKYGLVQGDDRGYRFYDQITRAELAKLLVYSLGLESEATRMVGRGTFADTRGHWAEGVIAVAKNVGVMRGYPEGDFRPQVPLTNAEVITALARLAGLEGSTEPWPRTYWNPALDAGIIPDSLQLSLRAGLNDAAARGDVFVLLWRTLTEVKNYQGQNLLRRYLDRTPPAVTLDPLPESTVDAMLDVTGTVKDAATVLVNGTPAHLQFNAFKGTVALRKGPNTIRVQAVDDAGNVKEVTVQVARTDSPIRTIALTGDGAVVPTGGASKFSLVIRDEIGEVMTDRSQVKAKVEPPELGTFDPATGTFQAGEKTGRGEITVWVGGAIGSAPVVVGGGALSRVAIEPAEVGLDALGTTQFKLKAFDRYGNETTARTVNWTASGGTITNAGVYTAPATAGEFTVTAVADGVKAEAKVKPLNYGVAQVTLTQTTTQLTANGLSETTLTATVVDDKGNTVTNYAGTLSVSSASPHVATPVLTQVPVTNGVAQVTVRAGSTPGQALISVKTNLDKAATATFTVNPQRLQSIRISGVPTPSTDTEPTALVEAVALDVDGNPMRSALPQMVVVRLTLNSNTASFLQNGTQQADIALGAVSSETGDVRTRTMIRYQAGTGTQVINGAIAAASQNWVQVYPGAFQADQVGTPSRLRIEPIVDTVAGQPQTVYVNVLDAEGYRVTAELLLRGISVTLRDQNGVTWPADPGAPGVGPGRQAFRVVQNRAGAYTYTATLQPVHATATAPATVVPGEATQLRVTADPAELVADNVSKTRIRAEVLDANGNLVKVSYPVTFRRTTNVGALQPFTEQTVYTRDGVADLQVTAGNVTGWDIVQALLVHPTAPNGRLADTVTVTTRGLPERLAISYGDNDGDGVAGGSRDHQGRAGQPLTVYVDVVDRSGNVVAADSNRSITLTLRHMVTGQESSQTVTTTRGRASFPVTRSEAAEYALKAESGTLMRAISAGYGGTLANAVIQPGGNFRIRAVADMTTLQFGGGSNYAEVKVQLLDAQNNVTANQTGRPLAVTLSFPNDSTGFNAGFFTLNDAADGVKTWTRTVMIPAGESEGQPVRFFSGANNTARTIRAATLDGAAADVSVSSTTLGTAANVVIQPIQAAPLVPWSFADSAVDGQVITVEVRDNSGRRLSNYADLVTLVAHDEDVRIVAAVRDKVLTTQDDPGGNGVGDYARTAVLVYADRGRAQFVVRANLPGVKLYEATAANLPATATAKMSATGRFDGEGPHRLRIEVSRERVRGGSEVILTARVEDRFGAWLTGAGGTVTFDIDGVVTGPRPLVNGVATYSYTAPSPADNDPVVVMASSSLTRTDGQTVQSQQSATFEIDPLGPLVQGLTVTSGRVDNLAGTVNEGDALAFTFNEAIDGSSVLAGLRAGTALTSGLGTVRFEASGRIIFEGLPALGEITVGGAVSATATFQVSSISLSADGKVLTLGLGARLTGTTPAVIHGGSVTVTGTLTVRDAVGNPWGLQAQPMPVTGQF